MINNRILSFHLGFSRSNNNIRASNLIGGSFHPHNARQLRYFASPVTRPPRFNISDGTYNQGPTAVVFMNMGGPSTLDQVGDFLGRLFSDPDIIPLGIMQNYLGRLIAKRRTPKIIKQYSEIGGGSPILRWTKYQAEKCCELLDTISPETAPHKSYIAFRYANPLTQDTYQQLLQDGFGERGQAIAFSQYPQYSCSTTGSSLNELWKCSQKFEKRNETGLNGPQSQRGIKWSVIDRWPTHPGLIDSFTENINSALEKYFPPEKRNSVLLLFSAHSLPISMVNRGDSYPVEVAASVHAVMQKLKFSNPYRLVWQSQVGPSTWLGPQTKDAVPSYIQQGLTNMLLIPIAFTSDHIETLFELEREIIGSTHLSTIKRIDSLNGSPTFIKTLANIVHDHLKCQKPVSMQLRLRCPGCTSQRCFDQKTFFARQF